MKAHLRLGTDSRLIIPLEGEEEITAEPVAGGAMVRWLADHLADSDQSAAVIENATVYEILDEKCAPVPPGCEGLICLPFQPGTEGSIPAAFVGLERGHTRYHLVRAVYEGSAFAVRLALEAARSEGAEIETLTADGPGARSRLWLQIHADVCGIPIEAERRFEPDPVRGPQYDEIYTAWRRAAERLGPGETT